MRRQLPIYIVTRGSNFCTLFLFKWHKTYSLQYPSVMVLFSAGCFRMLRIMLPCFAVCCWALASTLMYVWVRRTNPHLMPGWWPLDQTMARLLSGRASLLTGTLPSPWIPTLVVIRNEHWLSANFMICFFEHQIKYNNFFVLYRLCEC